MATPRLYSSFSIKHIVGRYKDGTTAVVDSHYIWRLSLCRRSQALMTNHFSVHVKTWRPSILPKPEDMFNWKPTVLSWCRKTADVGFFYRKNPISAANIWRKAGRFYSKLLDFSTLLTYFKYAWFSEYSRRNSNVIILYLSRLYSWAKNNTPKVCQPLGQVALCHIWRTTK